MCSIQVNKEASECSWYSKCSAPLCPYDQEAVENALFYPGEEICHLRDCPEWVKKQRAIIRVKPREDMYFTVEMLKVVDRVRQGIKGISPDMPCFKCKRAEQSWIRKH